LEYASAHWLRPIAANPAAMSPDELIVTVVAVVLGPVLWAAWLFRMSRVQRLQRRGYGLAVLAVALLACGAVVP
jgi:hypothetical protein